jgi:hypothetical protein
MPKSTVQEKYSAAKKVIEKTAENVVKFNAQKSDGKLEELLGKIGNQIAKANSVAGLSYKNPTFARFANDSEFKKAVSEYKTYEEKEREAIKKAQFELIKNAIETKFYNMPGVHEIISKVLGFEYNEDTDSYYTNEHSIQSMGGFHPLYDDISPLLGMNLDNAKFYFKDKDGREYMMEIWKGSYGFGMAYGAEIGIYYKNPDGKEGYTRFESGIPDWYACVEEKDHLKMKNTVWDAKAGKPLISNDTRDNAENGNHFWNLVIQTLNVPRKNSELYTVSEIEVPDETMRASMVEALKENSQIDIDENQQGPIITFTWRNDGKK